MFDLISPVAEANSYCDANKLRWPIFLTLVHLLQEKIATLPNVWRVAHS